MQRLQEIKRLGTTERTAAALMAGAQGAPRTAPLDLSTKPLFLKTGVKPNIVDTLAGLDLSGVGPPPELYIEEAAVNGANPATDDPSNLNYIYRVAVRATGGTDAAQHIPRTTYARKV